MPEPELDTRIRLQAFEHVRLLEQQHGTLTAAQIEAGFVFDGEQVHLATRAKGIFKPRQMQTLLSIKTVVPRTGRRYWYDDQRLYERALPSGEDFHYAFRRGGASHADNQLLRTAWQERIPIIYFLGISPGRYQAIAPAYIYGWDWPRNRCQVGPGKADARQSAAGPAPLEAREERRHYLLEARQRAHQASFRQALLDAYQNRCAISGLAEPRLIDAAHIVEDRHQTLGQPIVPNGLPLSKIHHAAFDGALIGVDPDYVVHVSEQLLAQRDGPTLEALKAINGHRIRLPARRRDYPDRERLAHRFEQFRAAM